MTSETRECFNCHGGKGVREFDAQMMSKPAQRGEKKIMLCVYCAGTIAGNAYQYPEQYEGADAMKAAAGMMNILEDRIAKMMRATHVSKRSARPKAKAK